MSVTGIPANSRISSTPHKPPAGHISAKRPIRLQGVPEGSTHQADQALQNFAAATFGRLDCRDGLDRKAFLGVELMIGWLHSEAAPRQDTEPSPGPVADFIHFRKNALRRYVSTPSNRPGVLVFHFMPSTFQLTDGHQYSLEKVHRLEASNYDRNAVLFREGQIGFVTHHGAT